MRQLSQSTVCFICGNPAAKANNHKNFGNFFADEEISSKWKEESVVVLSGLLCASGRSNKDTKDILGSARYCSKCDVTIKDLCWSFHMMDNLRNHMAGLVEKAVQNIFRHYEKIETESLSKRVVGSTKALIEALRHIIEDLEVSGWQSKNQEEIRACIFYNLADIEFPQSLKRQQKPKLRKKSTSCTKEDFDLIPAKNPTSEDTEKVEVKVKPEPVDLEYEYYDDDDGEASFVPEDVSTSGRDNKWNGGEDDNDDDANDDPVSDQDEFVPSENEADEEDDDFEERFSRRKRLTRSAVSYAEQDEEEINDEKGGVSKKKEAASKKTISNLSGSKRKKTLTTSSSEKRRRSEAFQAQRPFPCSFPKCSHRFTNEVMRDGHFEKVHKGNPKPFKCPQCDRCYVKTYLLNIHIACSHKGQKRLPKHKTYKCDICSELFFNEERLECHIGAKHPKVQMSHSCEICGKGFNSEEEVTSHKERLHVGETPFKCEDCGQVFANSVSLRFHVKTDHPIDESCLCKICNRTVTSAAHLKIHTRKNHPELFGIKYECQHCNTPFKTFYMLSHHQRRMHPEKMPGKSEFPCETCGVKFRRGEELKAHLRKHTGEKPFDCKLCGKKFRTVRDQKLHEQRHSGVRIMCDCCGKSFINSSSWRKHKSAERAKAARGESGTVAIRKPPDPNRKKRKRKPKSKKGIIGSDINNGNAEISDSTQAVQDPNLDTNPCLPQPTTIQLPGIDYFEQPQDLSLGVNVNCKSNIRQAAFHNE